MIERIVYFLVYIIGLLRCLFMDKIVYVLDFIRVINPFGYLFGRSLTTGSSFQIKKNLNLTITVRSELGQDEVRFLRFSLNYINELLG